MIPIITAAVGGGKTVFDLSKDIRKALQPDIPLLITVESSGKSSIKVIQEISAEESEGIKNEEDEDEEKKEREVDINVSIIEFKVQNIGVHSTYLEGLKLTEPKQSDATAEVVNSYDNNVDEKKYFKEFDREINFNPLRIRGGDSVKIRLLIWIKIPIETEKKVFGKLEILYTVAGGNAKSKTKEEFQFSMREGAP